MDQDRSTPIPGAEDGAFVPVFSPDGGNIVFSSPGARRWVDLATGSVRSVAVSGVETTAAPDVSWTDEDTLLNSSGEGIFSVPAVGGAAVRLTTADPNTRHLHPQLLPGGRAVLFNIARGEVPSRWDIVVEEIETHTRHLIVQGGSDPRYVASGHILFVRRGKLMAVPFDVSTLQATADPIVVVEDVMQAERAGNASGRRGSGQYAVADNGTLAYVPGGMTPVRTNEVLRVFRDGRRERVPLAPNRYLGMRLSPDGSRIVWRQGPTGEREVWMFDFAQGVPRRLAASERGDRANPVWSPDGTRVVVSADDADGVAKLEVITVDGSQAPQVLTLSEAGAPHSWSSTNVLALVGFVGGVGIWTMPMDGSEPARRVSEPGSVAGYPDFSPDGRWLAYVGNETGTLQVYVRRFPEGNPIIPVTSEGGTAPVWSRDGRTLYYRTDGYHMMAVPVTTEGGFQRLGEPRELFTGYGGTTPTRSYDIGPDGEFVIPGSGEVLEPQPVSRIQFVLNWFDELNRLAPRK